MSDHQTSFTPPTPPGAGQTQQAGAPRPARINIAPQRAAAPPQQPAAPPAGAPPTGAPPTGASPTGWQPTTRPTRDLPAEKVAAYGLDSIDRLPPRQRRWSINVQQALGLPSLLGQNQVLASTIATATRIEQKKEKSAVLAAKHPGLQDDAPFAVLLDALQNHEQLATPTEADMEFMRRMAETARDATDDAEQQRTCEKLLTEFRAAALRRQVEQLGLPPWDSQAAMQASAAKAELDLLSIPPEHRHIVANDAASTTATFWVNRTDASGDETKSFLCKPATTDPARREDGIPLGGEVAREALAGRAADLLAGRLGLSLDMPETSVVRLDQAFLPPNRRSGSQPVTCSVQQARASVGSLSNQGPDVRARIPAEQCAALAIFDLVTLNTDRHGGNLLVGPDGGLVPIDHGCSFVEGDEDGLGRVSGTFGAPRNALLGLPGSHAPMPQGMRDSLQTLDPSALAQQLKEQRDRIVANAPAMRDKVSDHAIAMSERATTFLQIAAGVTNDADETLSPASIQVAFGANAAELLAPLKTAEPEYGAPTDVEGFKLEYRAFRARCQKIAEQALRDQPLVAQMCLMADVEKLGLAKLLESRGWQASGVGPPDPQSLLNDPMTALRILASGKTAPGGDRAAAVAALRAAGPAPAPQAMERALADARIDIARELANGLPDEQRSFVLSNLKRNAEQLKADPAVMAGITQNIADDVLKYYTDKLAWLRSTYALSDNDTRWVEANLNAPDAFAVIEHFAKLERACKTGTYRRKDGAGSDEGTSRG
jgi:hypothetical protein